MLCIATGIAIGRPHQKQVYKFKLLMPVYAHVIYICVCVWFRSTRVCGFHSKGSAALSSPAKEGGEGRKEAKKERGRPPFTEKQR